MLDVPGNLTKCLLVVARATRANAFLFDRAVESLKLSVALRVVGARRDMCHFTETDERLEIFGDELWSVVADNSWLYAWMFFKRRLANNLDVHFGHRLAKIKVNDVATEPIEHADQEVERSTDLDVGDIDMPV